MSRLPRLFLFATLIALVGCATPTSNAPAASAPTEEAVATTEAAPEVTAAMTEEPTAAPTVAPTSIPRTEGHLILATTTSTQDSGLLDAILPDFTEKTDIVVDVVAVGTGQAIALGSSGDADVLLVHDRAAEDQFVEAGDGPARYDVMYNDFVIVGPTNDPAGIKDLKGAAAAFRAISDRKAHFISRGDKSGTHSKELALWDETGVTPKGDWYVSAGQGMGSVLTMAQEEAAYTLSDRATFSKRKADGLLLDILFEGDPILFNPYGVIPVSAEKHPGVNATFAQQFVDWITSEETQQLIADYKVNGEQLFTPNSAQWLEAHPK